MHLQENLINHWECGLPTLTVGQRGVAKSAIHKSSAEKLGWGYITGHPVLYDPTELKGIPAVIDGKAMFIPAGLMNTILNITKPTIVVWEDAGQAPTMVLAALMQLILERNINGMAVPDCVRFALTTNPASRGYGVSGILAPLQGRLAIIHHEADLDAWVNWAFQEELSVDLITAMKSFPTIFCETSEEAIKAASTMTPGNNPRTWHFCDKIIKKNHPPAVERDLISQVVGVGPSIMLAEHRSMCRQQVPSFDEILINPETTPFPPETELSARYAVAAVCGARITVDNFPMVYKYLDRKEVNQEYEAVAITAAVRRLGKPLKDTLAFNQWCEKNIELYYT